MAISELITVSTITGQSSFDGFTSIRQWSVHLWEVQPGQHSIARRIEIGHARLFTVPQVNLESLQECEILTGELETAVATLVQRQLRGPVALSTTSSSNPNPAATRIVEKLGFHKLQDEVWVRESDLLK